MTRNVCDNCDCADCTKFKTVEDPLYTVLMAVLQKQGELWEGDAHFVAEQVLDSIDWLKNEHVGSHVTAPPPLMPDLLPDPVIRQREA